MIRPLTLLATLLTIPATSVFAAPPDQAKAAPEIERFSVRKGYTVTLAATGLDNARFMEFDDAGTLYLSRPSKGDVLSLKDTDGDGFYETRAVFVSGLPTVHGLCFDSDTGYLWYAQTGAIHKAKDTNGDGIADEKLEMIGGDQIPKGGGHWWRSLLVTKSHVFTSIGDSGNINDETTTQRQKIWRFNKDGGDKTLWSSGVRNTEKLRLRPGTDEVWGCDHGSDWFGKQLGEKDGVQPVTDWNPPDELNHYEQGKFYGHPFVTGLMVPRYEFSKRDDIVDLVSKTEPPAWKFGAHWASNGFTFVDPTLNDKSKALPADHGGDMFVAFRGSWNRSQRAGYQVGRVLFDTQTGKPYGLLTIVSTLSADGQKDLARPVDCVQAPDGSILFSSDTTDRIYRIRSSTP
jgi:glucose/arabinose dehydrogenase